MGGCTPTAWGA